MLQRCRNVSHLEWNIRLLFSKGFHRSVQKVLSFSLLNSDFKVRGKVKAAVSVNGFILTRLPYFSRQLSLTGPQVFFNACRVWDQLHRERWNWYVSMFLRWYQDRRIMRILLSVFAKQAGRPLRRVPCPDWIKSSANPENVLFFYWMSDGRRGMLATCNRDYSWRIELFNTSFDKKITLTAALGLGSKNMLYSN